MVKIRLKNGSVVKVKDGKWICDNPAIVVFLTHFNREVEESSDYYPDPDAALAVNILKHLDGKIIYETQCKYIEGRIY